MARAWIPAPFFVVDAAQAFAHAGVNERKADERSGSAAWREGRKSQGETQGQDRETGPEGSAGKMGEAMIYALHSGDIGDAIYAMPAIRGLGGGRVYLCSRPFTKEMTPARFEALKALMEVQPYITGVSWHRGEAITHDFSGFRPTRDRKLNLAAVQAAYVGAPRDGWKQQWLHVKAKKNGCVIIARSPRYHNSQFPWEPIIKHFGTRVRFVGLADEHADFVRRFGSVRHAATNNLLEVAKLIAGSRLFIGNQSSPYAIAEGLKHPRIQETHERIQDAIFPGENTQYVAGDTVTLVKDGEAIALKQPTIYFATINASRPIAKGNGQHVQFKKTTNFGGVWAGVYQTNNSEEIGVLRMENRMGISEISAEEFEFKSK